MPPSATSFEMKLVVIDEIVQKYLSAGNSKCALFDTFYKSNRLSVIRIKISKELPTFPTFFLYAQIENGIFAMQSNTFGICCDVFFVIKIMVNSC